MCIVELPNVVWWTMVSYNLERARAGVQFLVDSPYYVQHVRKLRSTVQRPRALPFRDEAEVLNELVLIGRQNLQAMENMIDIAAFKRDTRADYQRQYMAAKRQRDRKVIAFEEVVAERKLSLDERHQALLKQYAVWNKELEIFLKKLGDLEWAEVNAKRREFWAKKEHEIDVLTAEASRTVQRKRRIVVPPKKTTTLSQAFAAAVDKRKPK